MKCPTCGSKSMVFDSRLSIEGAVIWRRRKCPSGHRWTTMEIEMSMPETAKQRGSKTSRQALGAVAANRIIRDTYDEIV